MRDFAGWFIRGGKRKKVRYGHNGVPAIFESRTYAHHQQT
jgi:hypothetical protein